MPIRFLFMTESHTALAFYLDQVNSKSIVIIFRPHTMGVKNRNLCCVFFFKFCQTSSDRELEPALMRYIFNGKYPRA